MNSKLDSTAGHIMVLANALGFFGTCETLSSVSAAWRRMTTIGKVCTCDIKILINAGIPVYRIYADAVGESVQDVQEALSGGIIDVQEFQSTFIKALSEVMKHFPALASGPQPQQEKQSEKERSYGDLIRHLYDFVIRVSSRAEYEYDKRPEEVEILPEIVKIILECNMCLEEE